MRLKDLGTARGPSLRRIDFVQLPMYVDVHGCGVWVPAMQRRACLCSGGECGAAACCSVLQQTPCCGVQACPTESDTNCAMDLLNQIRDQFADIGKPYNTAAGASPAPTGVLVPTPPCAPVQRHESGSCLSTATNTPSRLLT